jgi:hypothetical protein
MPSAWRRISFPAPRHIGRYSVSRRRLPGRARTGVVRYRPMCGRVTPPDKETSASSRSLLIGRTIAVSISSQAHRGINLAAQRPARLEESRMQRHGYGLVASCGDIAVALHEWPSALVATDASVEAELYACAVDLVMEYLEPCATLHDLLDAYVCPEIALMRLMTEVCTGVRFSCNHGYCCGRPARCSCATSCGKRSRRPASRDRLTIRS